MLFSAIVMVCPERDSNRKETQIHYDYSPGVVWYTLRDFIPGSAQALAELQRRGKQLTFVTNNSITSVEQHLQKLNSQPQLHIEKVSPTSCCSLL